MDINIRLSQPKDLPAYTDLLQKTYEFAYVDESLGLIKDCFSKEIFQTKNTQEYLLSRLENSEQQKTWLAIIEQQVVGSITYIEKGVDLAELAGFYVAPEYQGRGIGKKLYQKFLQLAIGRDLIMDLYAHNHKAIQIYHKWGWRLDPSRGDQGYFTRNWVEWPPDLQIKCLYMRLDKNQQ